MDRFEMNRQTKSVMSKVMKYANTQPWLLVSRHNLFGSFTHINVLSEEKGRRRVCPETETGSGIAMNVLFSRCNRRVPRSFYLVLPRKAAGIGASKPTRVEEASYPIIASISRSLPRLYIPRISISHQPATSTLTLKYVTHLLPTELNSIIHSTF